MPSSRTSPARFHGANRVHGHDGDDHEHDEERGQEPAGSSAPERADADPIRSPPLEDEQGRDQEAREDEEQVDAEEAAPRPREVVVVGDDRQHREGPQRIQRGVVTELGRSRYCRSVDLGHAASIGPVLRASPVWDRAVWDQVAYTHLRRIASR